MEVKLPYYLTHPNLFELQTTIVHKEGDLFQFQDSIFHLQGGGQPNDKGWISKNMNKYQILGGISERQTGRLRYKLPAEADNLQEGDEVTMVVDEQVRRVHAKIHSAGHLLDLAVQRLKYPWQVGKGYHFTDGPYVQYKGIFENAEKTLNQINLELNNIIEQQIESVSKTFSWQEAVQQKIITEDFKTSYVRVLGFAESSGPCGGTHISNTKDLKQCIVTKVQKKGKNVRVFYRAE